VPQPIVCASCGAKFASNRSRCPRCRAVVRAEVPSAPLAVSNRVQVVALSILAIVSVGAASVWLVASRKTDDTTKVVAVAPKPATGPVRPVTAGVPPAEDKSFLDVDAAASRLQGDPATALKRYDDAVSKDPNDADALNGFGESLVRAGRAGEAIGYFDRAIAAAPDEPAFVLHRARANAILNKWTECAADYRRAQELLPNDGAVAFNLAIVMRKTGDEEHAAAQLEHAVQLAPQDARMRREFAMTLERLHRPAEAAAAYKEYLWLVPDAPDADTLKAKISQLSAAPATPAAPGGAGKI
jgi:Flp pilus assembly protein TadD